MIGKSIGVSEKTSGESVSLEWTNSVALESTSVVKMPFGPESVGSYEANGEDLIINLKTGESVTVQDFFTLFGYEDELNELVLQDENGVLWSAQLDPVLGEFTFTEIASLDIATDSVAGFASGVPGWLKIGLAALAVGGIAASKSSGGSSSNNEFAYDDGSAPEALTDLTINDEGTVITGRGQPGAEVIIKGPAGKVGESTVQGDGNFEITLSEPQIDGERLVATQTDSTGRVSPETSLTAPDITAPGALTLDIDDDGAVVTVIGEPGAYVIITNPAGAQLGVGIIDDTGTIDIILIAPQTNGETLTATQTDAAGNTSPESTVTAKDTTPPKAPELVIDSAGEVVTVTGEPGAIVTIFKRGAGPIGVGVVDIDGEVEITLIVPQTSGEELTGTQTDGGGNTSSFAAIITAPTIPSGMGFKALFAEADDDTDIMMMGKAESDATVEAKDDTAMATGLASQYSSLSIDLSGVEDFSAIDEEQEFAALSVSFDDVLSIEDGDDFAPLLEPEEGQAFTIASTENSVVDIAGYDVQPVVDPLDDLLDQDNLYI